MPSDNQTLERGIKEVERLIIHTSRLAEQEKQFRGVTEALSEVKDQLEVIATNLERIDSRAIKRKWWVTWIMLGLLVLFQAGLLGAFLWRGVLRIPG